MSHHEDQGPGRAKAIEDDEVWGQRAQERAPGIADQALLADQETTRRQAQSWTDRFSIDSGTAQTLQTGALLASVAGFVYCLCGRRGAQQDTPKRRYGALGSRDPDADSDGDDGDDPRERRRMLELSSFGGEGTNSTGPTQRRGRRSGSSSGGTEPQDINRSRGNFPLASFASSSNSSASGESGRARAGQEQTAAGAEEDDAGEQLQRELELFAQDDDAEAKALIDSE